MTTPSTKNRTLSAARLLSLLAAVVLLSTHVEATVSCSSPSGSYQAGSSMRLSLQNGGILPPFLDNIKSITATISCAGSGSDLFSGGISNGQSFSIPEDYYNRCADHQIKVSYKYDYTVLLIPGSKTAPCDTISLSAPPQKPDPEPPTQPPPPPTQPPVTQPPTNPPVTQPPTNPTNPNPNNPPTQPNPNPDAKTTLTPTSPTTNLVPAATPTISIQTNTTLPPIGNSQTTTNSGDPQLPGAPPSTENQTQPKSGAGVPAAALGAVAGVAALALIVFGLVMTRRRKQMREEKLNRESVSSDFEKHGYSYDPTAVTTGSDDFSQQSLHNAPYVPMPEQSYQGGAAVGAASGGNNYGYAAAGAAAGAAYAAGRYSQSSESGALGQAATHAGEHGENTLPSSAILLPFPVPPSTSEALRQQYDLVNRMSVASQESMTDSLNAVGGVGSSSGAMAAAAAVNQQMSLKHQFDQEDRGRGYYGDEYSEVDESELNYLNTGSPSQTFVSARNSPTVHSSRLSPPSAYTDGAPSRSSAYETVRSVSPSTPIADSPTLSHASLTSQDITVPAIPTSDWRLPGGSRESHHIRQLIRNVLDGDDD